MSAELAIDLLRAMDDADLEEALQRVFGYRKVEADCAQRDDCATRSAKLAVIRDILGV